MQIMRVPSRPHELDHAYHTYQECICPERSGSWRANDLSALSLTVFFLEQHYYTLSDDKHSNNDNQVLQRT